MKNWKSGLAANKYYDSISSLVDSESEEQRLEVTDLNLVFLGQNQLVGPKDMH